VLGFHYLFSPIEGAEAPVDLVWLRNDNGIVIELTRERSDYDAETINRASKTHIALRTPDIDSTFVELKAHGVEIELEPLEMTFLFDRPLAEQDLDTFSDTDGKSATMRLAFFRGPSGERFEVLQDRLT
jgi:catechol 2,3-dioxygenase-like lactoylglutathione lyase family enzyme